MRWLRCQSDSLTRRATAGAKRKVTGCAALLARITPQADAGGRGGRSAGMANGSAVSAADATRSTLRVRNSPRRSSWPMA